MQLADYYLSFVACNSYCTHYKNCIYCNNVSMLPSWPGFLCDWSIGQVCRGAKAKAGFELFHSSHSFFCYFPHVQLSAEL